MTKVIPISVTKLMILGYIAKYRAKDGYCRDGSKRIAEHYGLAPDEVQEQMTQLIHDDYLTKGKVDDGDRHIPVKPTERANISRVRLFESMFPDIKSVLLRNR